MIKKTDPMDKYSSPSETIQYELCRLFRMEPRRNPEKPGRELVVNYDKRLPLVSGFEVAYSYYVKFFEKNNWAGNHYHEVKQELFIPITGDFRVLLKDVNNGMREEHKISSRRYEMLYVRPKVAHKVIATNPDAVLLVLATSPNNKADEYVYEI